MTYQSLFFDLDGTLIDPKKGITNAVQYALKQYGIHEDTDDLLHFIGPPLNKSFQKYYDFSEEKSMEAVVFYREYFLPQGYKESTLYDGITELLDKLNQSGFSLSVVTSKPTFMAEHVVKHHDLGKYFETIKGSKRDLSNVDKPTLIKETLALFQEKPRHSFVMIGDREHDIFGAQANNIDSIAVGYGYGSEEELKNSKPTYLVNSVADLEKLLLNNQV